MVLLYSNKVCELPESSNDEKLEGSLSYLKVERIALAAHEELQKRVHVYRSQQRT